MVFGRGFPQRRLLGRARPTDDGECFRRPELEGAFVEVFLDEVAIDKIALKPGLFVRLVKPIPDEL